MPQTKRIKIGSILFCTCDFCAKSGVSCTPGVVVARLADDLFEVHRRDGYEGAVDIYNSRLAAPLELLAIPADWVAWAEAEVKKVREASQ